MNPDQTRSYQLIEARLSEPLAQYVTASRNSGASWEAIARVLDNTTGVPIRGQTLRNWFPELATPVAS